MRSKSWFSSSPLRRMGYSSLVAATTSVFAKSVGFIKEIIVAASFGLSGAMDVYLVALVLIGMPVSILLNATQAAMISHLSSKNLDFEARSGLFITILLLVVGALAVILPIWMMVLPGMLPVLASGFQDEKRQALEAALIWLIPYYFLGAFNLLAYGVLQSRKLYWSNGLIPVATPVAIMAILLILGGDSWSILIIGLTLGYAVETALLLVKLFYSRNGKIFKIKARFDFYAALPIVMASVALLPGTAIAAFGPLVEQAVAASIGSGANAALAYGYKLPAAMQGILATAIGITALPYFASQIDNPAYCLHSLYKLGVWLFLGCAVLVLPLGVFSYDIVAFLYQRGVFDGSATQRVTPIQMAYFVQIPFAVLAMLGLKVMTALGMNAYASLYTALAVIIQSIFAYLLGIRYGVVGIAWASIIGSVVFSVISISTARSYLKKKVA